MKILVVHSRYRSSAPSGENVVVDQETQALRASGHAVEVFERRSDEIAGWPLTRRAALPGRVLWNGEVRRDLLVRLGQARPDVVHVHNTFPLLSPSVLYACREARVPVVVTFHNYRLLCATGDFFREARPCHDCAGGHGLNGIRHACYRGSPLATAPVVLANAIHRPAWRRLVSAYVFISAAQRDAMAELSLPVERVFVKHNFVLAPPSSPSVREHVVTYVGRLDAAKGVPLLMKSWDAFRAANPESGLRLVVVGGGPLEHEVKGWAATRAEVEFTGLLPREAAGLALRRSTAALVTSEWEETFGLVAVEAMAAGVAPIAPARGSFPELIVDHEDGFLFEAGDVRSLASALEEVDRHPQRFLAAGVRGRATYEDRFSVAAATTRLVDIYRFALANPVVDEQPEPSGDAAGQGPASPDPDLGGGHLPLAPLERSHAGRARVGENPVEQE